MEFKDLSRNGLIKLIEDYDDYITNDICQDEQNDMNRVPVCAKEFLNNEFLINNNEENIKLKVVSFENDYADEFTEAAADIMDIFEQVLNDSNISLPDSNREGNDDEARIFGETYYNMESQVEDALGNLVKKIYNDATNLQQ